MVWPCLPALPAMIPPPSKHQQELLVYRVATITYLLLIYICNTTALLYRVADTTTLHCRRLLIITQHTGGNSLGYYLQLWDTIFK